ncbi:DNA-directed RNA polymerase III, subunit Rpc31 [Tuber brumale]|nr:DNA-directed RNA polymerase III, subunit Rpc31 [Tuber brumale]
MEDPFNDASKYSAKYKLQKHRVPKLDSRPYVKEFFPEELWDTLGIDGDSDAEDGRGKEKGKVERLIFSALDVIGGLDEEDEEDGGAGGKGKKGVLQKLLGEGVGDDDDDDDDEVAEGEEEAEGDFGDNEEGDYNAEIYFNDGEDDSGDDWGDGGGGEDYY